MYKTHYNVNFCEAGFTSQFIFLKSLCIHKPVTSEWKNSVQLLSSINSLQTPWPV